MPKRPIKPIITPAWEAWISAKCADVRTARKTRPLTDLWVSLTFFLYPRAGTVVEPDTVLTSLEEGIGQKGFERRLRQVISDAIVYRFMVQIRDSGSKIERAYDQAMEKFPLERDAVVKIYYKMTPRPSSQLASERARSKYRTTLGVGDWHRV